MKNIGFQKIHKFNTATAVNTTFATTKATATSWATNTNTTSAVTTSTTATSNWVTEWYTNTSTVTTWSTSSLVTFNTSTSWAITVGASSTWSTSSTIQTLKATSTSFNTSVAKSKSTYYYRSTSYSANTTKYRNTTKSRTTSWTASTTYSGSGTVNFTTYYNAATYRTTCTYPGGGGGGFYCLPTGTQININTTETKPIEDLQIGDTILSKGGGFNTDDFEEMHAYDVANMTGQLRETTVTNHFSTISDDNIDFNNGLLVATRLHYQLMKIEGRWAIRPIYLAQKYVELNYPVFFADVEGNEIEITSAVIKTDPITVWEIDTEPNDVFYANGLLTHNHKRQ